MKCSQCGKEFEAKRASARFCSTACRVTASRVSVTPEKLSVTNKPVSVTKAQTFNWYLQENKDNFVADPLERITIIPDETVTSDWYASQDFKNLNEELEKKSIEQLEEEGYFIPAWKNGYSHNPIEDINI